MRSKALLVSNILATVYSLGLLFVFGGAIIQAGGMDYVYALGEYFNSVFELLELIGASLPWLTILYVIFVLLCVHISLFALGCLIGWISYAGKRSGGAKFAAVLYLLGTICFPLYLYFGLPITIIGFTGGGKQAKINKEAKKVKELKEV